MNDDREYRLRHLEQRLDALSEEVDKVNVLEERVANMISSFKAMRNALWGAAGGLVLLAVSVVASVLLAGPR